MAPSKRHQPIKILFVLISVIYLAIVVLLVFTLPDSKPLGGPDESLHISLTEYLVNHHSWPAWDSNEVKRYVNGASYATGSSFGYWIEAFFLEISGRSRMAGLLLYTIIISILFITFRKVPLAGLVVLALLTPQTFFIFSYVNSDAWSCLIAFFLGCAIVRFKKDPLNTYRISELMIASGACISCRFQIWAIGFFALVLAITPHLKTILQKNLKGLMIALVAATVIASWWPVTSYSVNDGDFVGLESGQKAVEKFGKPEAETLAQPLDQFEWAKFAVWTSSSFYGRWGWMTVALPGFYYWTALLLFTALTLLSWSRMIRWLPIFLSLIILNVILLIVYSTTYDFQAQGRYLFGSYFIVLGIMSNELVTSFAQKNENSKKKSKRKLNDETLKPFEKRILTVSLLLIACNILSTTTLYSKVHSADASFHVRAGIYLLKQGEWEQAEKNLRSALRKQPEDHNAYNLLGLAVLRMNRLDEAEVYFKKSIELDSKQLSAYLNLARFYLAQGRVDEAITQGNIAINLHPQFNDGHRVLISAYESKQDAQKLKELCSKILEINPDNLFANEYLEKLDESK